MPWRACQQQGQEQQGQPQPQAGAHPQRQGKCLCRESLLLMGRQQQEGLLLRNSCRPCWTLPPQAPRQR
jgi:hypothetical protein